MPKAIPESQRSQALEALTRLRGVHAQLQTLATHLARAGHNRDLQRNLRRQKADLYKQYNDCYHVVREALSTDLGGPS